MLSFQNTSFKVNQTVVTYVTTFVNITKNETRTVRVPKTTRQSITTYAAFWQQPLRATDAAQTDGTGREPLLR